MADAAQRQTSLLPLPALGGGGGPARHAAGRGLRLTMVLAFGVLALAVLAQGYNVLRLEAQRRADADVVTRAGEQHTLVLQFGRQASLIAADPAGRASHTQALGQLLAQSGDDALALEALLARPGFLPRPLGGAGDAGAGVRAALETWQTARERLVYRGGNLLRQVADAEPGDLSPGVLAVQTEAVTALAAAQRLSAALRSAAERNAAGRQQALHWGLAGMLVLLLLLGLTVAAASARVLRRQAMRLRAEAAELRRLALVAEHTSALVVVTDRDDRVLWVNEAFAHLSGWPLADAAGHHPDELLASPHADAAVLARMQKAINDGAAARDEWLHRTRDGHDLWLDVDLRPLHDDAGRLSGFLRIGTDVTSRVQQQRQPQALCRALSAGVAVIERLERAIAHARRHPGYGFAVLSIGFQRLEPSDDALGPGADDDLLCQVAERLQLVLRPGDVMARMTDGGRVAARSGGGEFIVVLEGVHDARTLGVIANRLVEDLNEPYLLGSAPVPSGASLGALVFTGGQASAEKLLRDAGTAMVEARRAGDGRWVMFDDSMHERVVRALALENDLRRALEVEELFLTYQPVVDLATGVPLGVEALVQWHHPQRGLVPPEDFIGVAEQSGLIDAVGSFVLRNACLQFVRWRRELGRLAPRYLALNLSRAQLRRGDLVPEIAALLQESTLHPAQLQLEITDPLAAQDEQVQTTLRELKALGVTLALDDFGAGHSSLACLHRLPVDTVKIDRSFVGRAETVEYQRVLIEATIRVARALGMTTVAEGIENEAQAALMLQLECDRGQGLFYARPLVAADFETWVRQAAAASLG
jgi:PAS domain S-box-containing protein/diguanylate cyclase (GGDEF)-like protein